MMKILVVAPDHQDLPNAALEIAAIHRYHDVTLRSGLVRDSDIARAIEDGPYDILWFITHGTKDGVLLSDGMLSIEGVGQYLRASAASLCVLNTCDSENVALEIIAGGQADIICTLGAVDNRDAIRLGSLLADKLANTDSYYDAYAIVAPPGGLYRYLRAGRQYRRHEKTSDQATIADLYRVLAGDKNFGGDGLVKKVDNLEIRVGALEKRQGNVEEKLTEVQADVVDLKKIIRERVDQNQIHITRGVAISFAIAFLVLALVAGVGLWSLARGGQLDGSVGFAVPAVCSLSNYCRISF